MKRIANNLVQITSGGTAPERPALVFTGKFVTLPGCCGVPLYDLKPPAPGKLDINTCEGWNRQTCRLEGRTPTSEEVAAWRAVDAEEEARRRARQGKA